MEEVVVIVAARLRELGGTGLCGDRHGRYLGLAVTKHFVHQFGHHRHGFPNGLPREDPRFAAPVELAHDTRVELYRTHEMRAHHRTSIRECAKCANHLYGRDPDALSKGGRIIVDLFRRLQVGHEGATLTLEVDTGLRAEQLREVGTEAVLSQLLCKPRGADVQRLLDNLSRGNPSAGLLVPITDAFGVHGNTPGVVVSTRRSDYARIKSRGHRQGLHNRTEFMHVLDERIAESCGVGILEIICIVGRIECERDDSSGGLVHDDAARTPARIPLVELRNITLKARLHFRLYGRNKVPLPGIFSVNYQTPGAREEFSEEVLVERIARAGEGVVVGGLKPCLARERVASPV